MTERYIISSKMNNSKNVITKQQNKEKERRNITYEI